MPDADSPLVRPPAPAATPVPAEALVICRLCGESVNPGGYEFHLQNTHALYAYRGVHGSRADTIDLILDDLVTLTPAHAAWQALVRLTRSESDDGDRQLAELLAGRLARVDPGLQLPICKALATLLAPGHVPFLLVLAGRPESTARIVALLGLAAPAVHGSRATRMARELIADDGLPLDLRCQALAAVLARQTEPAAAVDHLLKLARKMGRKRAFDLFTHLEDRIGPQPVLLEVQGQLESRLRMTCPRCGVELRQPQMKVHLWQEHRLLLDGLRVREPWGVVEDWLNATLPEDRERLERCRVAAKRIDPTHGPRRLTRLLLGRGLADDADRRDLLAEAAEQHSGCCPWCFAFVAVPREEGPLKVRLRDDSLESGGYQVRLHEKGLWPKLDVRTPRGVIFKGLEPGRTLTSAGAAFLAAGSLVFVALVVALVWPMTPVGPLRPVVLLLIAAWLIHFLARLGMGQGRPTRQRLLGYAWSMLVPGLHVGAFASDDSAFAAGLVALADEEVDEGQLADLVRITSSAADRGEAPPSHLATLLRLQIELAAEDGDDPVALVVRQLTRCFAGKRPMALAQHLLVDWAADWWTRGNRARLRLLLCDQAFEAGFEVSSLLEAGEHAPALGTVFGTDAPRSLAALRLLWSQRPTRPWDRFGAVRTAFELAETPEHLDILTLHPDALLWQRLDDIRVSGVEDQTARPATIVLTLRGLWLQDELFMVPPRVVEVRRRSLGTEMTLARATFRSPDNLEPLALLFERWTRWVFHEFLPQVDRVLTWQPPDRGALMRAWGVAACPECGRRSLPRVGEVGTKAE